MLTRENLEEILFASLKTGADFAEIFIEDTHATSINCEDNKIEKIAAGTESGAGLRIIKGKETAYSALTDLSLDALLQAAKQLSQSFSGENQFKKIELKPRVAINQVLAKDLIRPEQVAIEEKAAKVENLDQTARSFGEKIKQVTVRYTDSNQAVTIANSEGVYVEDNRIYSRYFINVIVEKDQLLQTGYEAPGIAGGFEIFDLYPAEEYAAKATERALKMLEAPYAPAGKMAVVLSSAGGGTLVHEACGHALEADFALKGTSIFTAKIGQKVASQLVTVMDGANLPGKFGSFSFDDEGTPSQATTLIEQGILKAYMSDHFNAKQLKIPLSGNGRRESFKTKPVPRMTNTYIAPGKMDPEEIIASVKDGLLVKKMGGGQVNVVNGDFVFEVSEGYLIENGKIKHPVRGAILTGNGPQILEIIDMVGSDLGFQAGVCGKFDLVPVSHAQPTIRVPEIIVGGRV